MMSFVPAANAVAVPGLVPLRSVPLDTAFTTNAVTVPSTSASSPCAAISANVISTCVSSATVSTTAAIAVSVGASLTAVTLTCTGTGVADSSPPSSLATTVNAPSVPLASCAPVQYALLVASIVSLVPTANAVAVPALVPISNVPLDTAFTTNAVTVPSTSASS